MQFRFILGFVLLLAVLLICLNTIPMIYSRDVIISEKERSLNAKAGVVSSSLAPLESLSTGNVSQVLGVLDIKELARIIVVNEQGVAVYDTFSPTALGKYVLLSPLSEAFSGKQFFSCRYKDNIFVSKAAAPVRSMGKTVGAVYLTEVDPDSASLIVSIQERLLIISLVVCAAVFALAVIFSRAFTARITRLSQAIAVVSSGNYEHRIEVSGDDELTELGHEFNELTLRLQKTEAARRQFVSDASHELNTPLAAIRLLSDSIIQSDEMDSSTMREFVGDIGAEATRLQHTSEKLLSLSRHDDKHEFAKKPVDLGSVAAETLKMLNQLAKPRRITLNLSAEPDCYVTASDGDIYQIIFNLAENAIKYNNDGGTVDIDIVRRDNNVILTVEDSGIGIPPEDLPYIFQRFYRVDKARSREGGGSGLGLSIVHAAVTAIGGSIEAESKLPNVTRFTAVLPAAETKEDAL